MTTSLITHLCNVAMKPGTSMSTSLITTRRICRIFGQRLDSIRAERRAIRRDAGKLRHYLPFTAAKIYEIQQRANEHRHTEWEDVRTVLAAFGRSLVLDTEGLANGLGFDRLCDLLAVNTVERETARKDGLADLADLVFAYALEESAARRGQHSTTVPCSTPANSQPRTSSRNALRTCCPTHLPLAHRSAQSCRPS